VGCLSNPTEEASLSADAYQDKIVRGLAAGLRAIAEDTP